MTREEAIRVLEDNRPSVIFEDEDAQKRMTELCKAIDMAIEALTNEWTPITVSEPNTSDHVLVTYKWDEDDYETSELDYWVTKCAAEEGNKQCQMFIDHVIAWQSLPTPCKGGDDE